MIPGSMHVLSLHDRMILDLEKRSPSSRQRDDLCVRIDLPRDRFEQVLEGLADTDAAYTYAPEVVRVIRHRRAEKFKFERRHGRWKTKNGVLPTRAQL